MARKTTKTATIQTTVDQYATQRQKSIKLREAMHKASQATTEAGAALIAHVKATTSGGKVAFHAANGDTLIVTPQYGGSVDTVSPGQQELPQAAEPATAGIAESVAELLSKGRVAEAQQLIIDAESAKVNTDQTATKVAMDMESVESRVAAWMGSKSDILDAMVYGISPRLFYHGAGRRTWKNFTDNRQTLPLIAQETYKSATLGPIKASARAKALFLVEREAISKAIKGGDYNAAGMQVSRARGEIAKYISELEQEVNDLRSKTNAQA